MNEDPYVYPGTDVLRNLRDVRDAAELAQIETDLTAARLVRLTRGTIEGRYDLEHLQAFHRFLFEGLYEWAGQTRTVNIAKTTLFCPAANIKPYSTSVFAKLTSDGRFRAEDRDVFVHALAEHLADVNALHPFREGNGRAQRAFFSQLARDAGYKIRWSLADRARNDFASAKSLNGDNGPLRDLLDDLVHAR